MVSGRSTGENLTSRERTQLLAELLRRDIHNVREDRWGVGHYDEAGNWVEPAPAVSGHDAAQSLVEHKGPRRLLALGPAALAQLPVLRTFGNPVAVLAPGAEMADRPYGIFALEGTPASLPFPDDSAHLITFIDVLEHTGNEKNILKEAFRVLKPYGQIVVFVPVLDSNTAPHTQGHRYTPEVISAYLEGAGFTIEKIKRAGVAPYFGAIIGDSEKEKEDEKKNGRKKLQGILTAGFTLEGRLTRRYNLPGGAYLICLAAKPL